MNYRHIYHAGNVCDIVKHAVVSLLVERLKEKETPFTFFDTHGGAGLYDLEDERAQKTDESGAGFQLLMRNERIPVLSAYYSILNDLNPDGIARYYPGSPLLARKLMRAQDHLIVCDLHPEEAHALHRLFKDDEQVHIHQRDGYEAMLALLPPETKRGLVLIDPPYEEANEYDKLVRTIKAAHKRWPTGQYAIWYPIKDRPALWLWRESMEALAIPKQLCAEFIYEEEIRSDRLNGSGLLLINPPWRFEENISSLFNALHDVLETSYKGTSVEWITPA